MTVIVYVLHFVNKVLIEKLSIETILPKQYVRAFYEVFKKWVQNMISYYSAVFLSI